MRKLEDVTMGEFVLFAIATTVILLGLILWRVW